MMSSSPAVTNSLPAAQTLFVWDFDWTIVNCNSDEYVVLLYYLFLVVYEDVQR